MLTIRKMKSADIPAVRKLVESTEGLAFKAWETDAVLRRLLTRCRGLSQVAIDESGKIVGSVFIGEGLMAFVHHLAVHPEARGKRIATLLVKAGLSKLLMTKDASRRVYITTLQSNLVAQSFWTSFGATRQSSKGQLVVFTMDLSDQPWHTP